MRRRDLLIGAGACLGAGAFGVSHGMAAAPVALRSRRTSYQFRDTPTQGLVSLADGAPPPLLRVRQGARAVFDYTNGLEDYSTIHWHGIRLPNAMDGVPYLTQFPVGQGETFRYDFTPPDAGTYWYHPHCRTMEQMAQGLTGLLVVEEREDPGFDADLAFNLKDFRLDDAGAMLPYFTPRGAARGGTLGNVQTVNWQNDPVHEVPAGGIVRLRLAATDTTRVYKLVLPDLPGRIIAWDGHPVDAPMPWPTLEAPLLLGPGQRVDVALVMPPEGADIALTGLLGYTPHRMARLRPVGSDLGRAAGDIPVLLPNPIARPDPAGAEVHEVVFGWSPDGSGVNNGLCGTYDYVFWSINRSPWPGDAVEGVGPVLNLAQGRSHVLRLRNESPNLHPIHLHGLVFKPLRSNLRQIPANYGDTLLLLKNEVVDVLLQADNPGDWAFHCHVIEHQKTGLSGYVRVG
ncbi:MAG: multicopper oxidase family protein [Marinibacterium sp.]|nr:multicopper oxidase family protein [Marinibacterium sp.]